MAFVNEVFMMSMEILALRVVHLKDSIRRMLFFVAMPSRTKGKNYNYTANQFMEVF